MEQSLADTGRQGDVEGSIVNPGRGGVGRRGGVLADSDTTDADLDRFVAEHYQRLVGLAVYRTGDRQAAEDLAQEALLRLVSNWDQVASMERPWNWLAVVLVNLSNSRLRRQQVGRRVQSLLGRRREEAAPAHGDPGDRLGVLESVQALPDRQRTAVLLRHYAGLSVRQTAEVMRCAEGTVKSLTYNGIEQLRQSFAITDETMSKGGSR